VRRFSAKGMLLTYVGPESSRGRCSSPLGVATTKYWWGWGPSTLIQGGGWMTGIGGRFSWSSNGSGITGVGSLRSTRRAAAS
jgi:hypothetical protein